MTHSLEELKRQWQAAEDVYRSARRKADDAKARYRDAQFAATGLSGCLAEATDWRGKAVRFLPQKMGKWDYRSEVEGPILKKDGAPGERTFSAAPDKVTNLGPYTREGSNA